jgi:hypothetical protein
VKAELCGLFTCPNESFKAAWEEASKGIAEEEFAAASLALV